MVQAAPDPTIWGNKMVTKVSTRPMSDDTEEHKASENSETSTISSLYGALDSHDSISLQEANRASRVDMDDNRTYQSFNSSDDAGRHERKATPIAGKPNGEPNIQQSSTSSHSLEPEPDSLLAVNFLSLFRVFRVKLT